MTNEPGGREVYTKRYTVTFSVEADAELSETVIEVLLLAALDAVPTTPYLDYEDFKLEED